MELMKKNSTEQYSQALESWKWLIPENAVPLLASSFGDIFFAYKRKVFFLDLVNGSFDLIAESMDELEGILNSSQGQENYLMATLSLAMQKKGFTLEPDEVFDFKETPKLGGKISLENVQVMNFVTAVHIAGQIHQQIKDLPPGSKITNVNIIDS